jgi:MFS transporter, DHA3 family, macrolide efflux protein
VKRGTESESGMGERQPPRGFLAFCLIWLGQTVSMFGSGLSYFALGVWVYQTSGSVTSFALVSFCAVAPLTLLSPLAGALVDRWDRRMALLVSDLGAGLTTLILLVLFWTGRIEVWHMCVTAVLSSLLRAPRFPALAASITLLIPKKHLARGNAMVEMGGALSSLLAPLVAGFLVGAIGIQGVLLIDVLTFLVAIGTLLAVRIPKPEAADAETSAPPSLLREAAQGWHYLKGRSGLLGMLALVGVTNFAIGMVQTLITPLVLSFAPSSTLGVVLFVAGLGMLVGSLGMAAWGGPRQRMGLILSLLALQGLVLLAGGWRPNAWLIATAAFVYLLCIPVVASCSQAIWQSKVPAGLQGRIFAIRQMVSNSSVPIAYLVAGPLADSLFEPLLAAGGPLAASVGRVLGVGPGRGIGLLFIALGASVLVTVAIGLQYRPLREVERELPDALPDLDEPAVAAS